MHVKGTALAVASQALRTLQDADGDVSGAPAADPGESESKTDEYYDKQYGQFVGLSVLGIVGFASLLVLGVFVYRRIMYNKTLPRDFTWHFYLAHSEDEVSETKADQLRELLQLRKYKVWFEHPLAEEPTSEEGVRLSTVLVVLLTPSTLQSKRVVRELELAAEQDKPIVLVHDPMFPFDDLVFCEGCPEVVEHEVVPKLLECVESIEFSFRSDSARANNNAMVRALEEAYFDRKSFVYSQLRPINKEAPSRWARADSNGGEEEEEEDISDLIPEPRPAKSRAVVPSGVPDIESAGGL